MTLSIPDKLKENVRDEWGSEGEAWLEALPALLQECRKLWHLELQTSSFELSYNYVTSVGLCDGTPAILKIGYPNVVNETKALRVLNGHCTVRLLQSDENLGALLLEKIEPGTPLTSIQRKDDEYATLLAADLLKNLPVSPPDDETFPTVAEWGEVFQRVKAVGRNPLPPNVLEKAQSLLGELEQGKTSEALLHGDLHHDNILFDDQRGWLSIDPKGVIGDPLFNAARFLNNPRPDLIQMESPEKITERRLEILSSIFNSDRYQLAAWAFVDCILSACWLIESGGETINYLLRCAKIFDAYLSI